jgi:MFS family permease
MTSGGDSLKPFAAVVQNANLRRVALAHAASMTTDAAFTVALGIFAFERGGVAMVGIVGFVRMFPAAIATPVTTVFTDRYERERVLRGSALLAGVALGASAGLYFAGGSVVGILVLAAVQAVLVALWRPSIVALLPSLASTPEQLVAGNATTSTLDGFGALAGPLIAGLLVALANPGVVFVVGGAICLMAIAPLSRIRVEGRLRFAHHRVRGGVASGFRLLARAPGPRLVVGLVSAQALVRGALNVLVVVIAFRLLDAGGGWVGVLSGAVGAGTLLGGAAAVSLAGRRLAMPFRLGLVLWGVPIALIAAAPQRVVALLLLGVVGVGNAIEDVAGETLLQRLVGDAQLARVLGVLFGVATAGVGVGSLVTPAVVSGLGVRGALLATGLLLPALVGLSWAGLRRLDAQAAVAPRALALVASVPMFAPLPVAAKEHLARKLISLTEPPGSEIVRQGEEGHRFYIVAAGRAQVTADGRTLRELGPGDSFGEIALLRDVPRTATVTAGELLDLYALDRDDFLAAVTGHRASREAGEAVVAERLGAAD